MPPKRQSFRPPPMRRTATPLPGMNMTRSVLPAEIISTVLDYLPVCDLMVFARVSRQLQEMVYDDSRWVTKLQLMDVWNEGEARKRFEDAMRKKRASDAAKHAEGKKLAESVAGKGNGAPTTLFDAAEEQKVADERRKEALRRAEEGQKAAVEAEEEEDVVGLQTAVGEMGLRLKREPLAPTIRRDPESWLTVLETVKSVRGFARQEFGRVYGALATLYLDLVKAKTHTDRIIFRIYDTPEKQAKMLAQLWKFSGSDTTMGWAERIDRLKAMMEMFENAALREFEFGYEKRDVDGRMKRYANVLLVLNGGQSCIQLFVQKHSVLYERDELGNPMDCFDKPMIGAFSLEPAKTFWSKLAEVLKEQARVIDQVYPPTVSVMLPFLERIAEDVITEYITPILDEAHDRDMDQYLKGVTGLLKQSIEFGAALEPSRHSADTFTKDVQSILIRVFDAHVDLYLQEELDYARQKFEAEVESWEKKIEEQDAATESFFMSNVNREAEKRDFLTTFKKVILAPVSVIPSAFTTSKQPTVPEPLKPTTEKSPYALNEDPSRLSVTSAGLDERNGMDFSVVSGRASPIPAPPPTTELAAKAAIMNSRLEGIRSLFSLEVALNLVHMARESLERAAIFTGIGGQTGEEAREQCEAIFVALLQVLGLRHVKTGFDKAVEHLRKYNPRDVAHTDTGVAPLVTFLDLVNVGDLIQQMIDVFYEQELVAKHLTDRNDFLNPAVKEKKRFEQMLDERVAAGLNVGIDVLIDEVEHIFATTQQVTDFNPGALTVVDLTATGNKRQTVIDMAGPSPTAQRVVEIVGTHTGLLNGSTDKNVLDVFNQEVGIRLFTAVCKHIKRQRISVDGAIRLISDVNHYYNYVEALKLKPLIPYFSALRELAQIYLIDPGHAKQMAAVIADPMRFGGIFRVEEVYEYATRREDWYTVKRNVERAMYGFGCGVM